MFTPAQHRADGLNGPTYTPQGNDPEHGFDPDFDESAFNEPAGGATTVIPAGTPVGSHAAESGGGFGAGGFDDPFADDIREPAKWHGGADFGLLMLRLVVGGTAIVHGLQDLFGLFHGMGVHQLAEFLTTSGFKQPTILAWVTGGTELGAGALLVLGLFTPLAAAGLLGLMINLVALSWKSGFVGGFEYPVLVAGVAIALLFTGPGRVALDRPTPWFRHPVANGIVFLIIGGGAGAAVWYVLHHAVTH